MLKYLLVIFIFPAVCISETSVWHVSKNGNELYLGGTIHVLKKEDYPLPVEFNEAFKRSDILVLETDIEAAKKPEFSKKFTQLFIYPSGQSLKNVISNETYIKLEKYLAETGVSIEQFLSYKPAMVVLAISIIELEKMGMVDVGVDEYFYKKARQLEKETEFLETLDEQLEFLLSMGKGNANELIQSTLDDMGRMESMMNVIKTAWVKGDENKMAEVTLSEMIRDYPDLYQTLLVKRNNNWMPQIEKMMLNKRTEIILVGALHLVGEKGLLQQLRNKGYVIKQFKL